MTVQAFFWHTSQSFFNKHGYDRWLLTDDKGVKLAITIKAQTRGKFSVVEDPDDRVGLHQYLPGCFDSIRDAIARAETFARALYPAENPVFYHWDEPI